MADDREQSGQYSVEEGHSSDSAKEFDPFQLPKDDSSGTLNEERYVPIGHPISPRDYDELKQRARDEKIRPSPSSAAQEDKTP